MRALLVAAVVLAVLVGAGCSEGDPGADGDVESLGALVPGPVAEDLTRSGGCPDGLLWAADETGDLVVTVEAEGAVDEVVLPSTDVDVTVLHGADLVPDLCTDDLDPTATSPGVQGQVTVERDDGCAAAFRIDGLEAEDGTTFGPIEVAC